jgi:hypothetical protein
VARMTVTTQGGEVRVYDRVLNGNLARGRLIVCGPDGPAYLGRAGYMPIDAHMQSAEFGGIHHLSVVVANGNLVHLSAYPPADIVRLEYNLMDYLPAPNVVEMNLKGLDVRCIRAFLRYRSKHPHSKMDYVRFHLTWLSREVHRGHGRIRRKRG